MKKTKSTKNKSKTGKTSAAGAPRSKKVPGAMSSLLLENADLRLRLSEAEETLTAIRKGEVDALVVSGPHGEQVYALKGAERPYRILVESMNEGALSLTANGSIINCNKAFAKIAGEPCGMLIGTLFRDMVSKKDRERFKAFWKQAVEAEAKTEIELDFNGRTVPAYVSINARMHEGECWVFAVVTDISARKRAEAELAEYRLHLERMVDEKTEQIQAMNEELQTANEELLTTNEELSTANKELDAFAYSVSHDLRAPLRTIEGFSKAIEEDQAGRLDDKGKDYFRRVQAATEKMGQLIDALLGLSRFTRRELRQTPVYLTGMARSIIEDLRRNDPGRGVECVIPDDIRAKGDLDMLRIVLTNLLQNAWKFTGKRDKAVIEFGVARHNGKPIYFVKDNGAGFDMTYVDKLFNPFQRLHSADEFPGIGIGLATVKRIIEKHGGRVWIEGAPDKGATVFFTL